MKILSGSLAVVCLSFFSSGFAFAGDAEKPSLEELRGRLSDFRHILFSMNQLPYHNPDRMASRLSYLLTAPGEAEALMISGSPDAMDKAAILREAELVGAAFRESGVRSGRRHLSFTPEQVQQQLAERREKNNRRSVLAFHPPDLVLFNSMTMPNVAITPAVHGPESRYTYIRMHLYLGDFPIPLLLLRKDMARTLDNMADIAGEDPFGDWEVVNSAIVDDACAYFELLQSEDGYDPAKLNETFIARYLFRAYCIAQIYYRIHSLHGSGEHNKINMELRRAGKPVLDVLGYFAPSMESLVRPETIVAQKKYLEKLDLIPVALLEAQRQGIPYRGYRFVNVPEESPLFQDVMEKQFFANPPPENEDNTLFRNHNLSNAFLLIATPAEHGKTGKNTYLILTKLLENRLSKHILLSVDLGETVSTLDELENRRERIMEQSLDLTDRVMFRVKDTAIPAIKGDRRFRKSVADDQFYTDAELGYSDPAPAEGE